MTRGSAAAVLAVAALAVLSGCSEEPASAMKTGDPTELGLDGPWAQEFADAIASSTSPSERAILADGVVTPAELEAAHDGVRRCLRDSGLTINYFREGGFEVGGLDGGAPGMPFERSDAILRACEQRNDDWVTYLFQQTRRNPEKLDDATIEIACFKRVGLVDRSYSRRDYDADNETGTGPIGSMAPKAQQCRADPLGLWWDE